MTNVGAVLKKLVVGAVAIGALSLGGAGIASAATSPAPRVGAHFNCARATRLLSRIDRGEARIAAGLPRLTAAEAKAKQAGNTKRADRLQKVISRLESLQFKARLAKASQTIEAKCHVPAPAPASTPGSTSTTAPASA